MDLTKVITIIATFVIMSYGLKFILLSKNKLQGKSVKDKDKKLYFISGTILFILGFVIFLFFIIITLGSK